MARIEWVKHRLENWALWKDREGRGGLGYATQSVLLSEPGGGYRESVIPIDDIDASVTNTAVESLKPTRSHLYMTLQHIYVQGIGIKETSRRMARAESTIKANLDAADHALSEWFGERAEKQKRVFTPYTFPVHFRQAQHSVTPPTSALPEPLPDECLAGVFLFAPPSFDHPAVLTNSDCNVRGDSLESSTQTLQPARLRCLGA